MPKPCQARCSTCNGAGEVTVNIISGSSSRKAKERCTPCRGTGKV
ncbi:hypothetical protein [Streptomyces sp. NRRL F-2890]|nr:hypothetical protein [Streptomyces sp. NRRL F-2890]